MPAFVTIDVIIIASIFIVFLLASLKFRKSFLVTFILSFYPAYFLFNNITQIDGLQSTGKILSFIGIFVALYYILEKYIITDYSYIAFHKYFQAIVLSAVSTSLLLCIYYFILPSLSTFHNFGPSIDTLFKTTVPMVAWLGAPFVALFITNKG